MKLKIIFVLILFFAFIARIYNLSELPGEWFGDISNVHEYVSQILTGEWPFYFFQSPGPFYHYLISPFVIIFNNQGYETYKFASVAVSILGLLGIYLFGREIANRRIALLCTLISSVSFWYLVWSRLGNSQIAIPGLTAFAGYFLARYIKSDSFKDLLLSILVASLGWYTYPQTFILPVIINVFLLIIMLFKIRSRQKLKQLSGLFILAIIGFLPFIFIISGQNKGYEGNFTSTGYVGSKIFPVLSMPKGQLVGKLANNFAKTFFMLHVVGDRTFRVNIPGAPQVDKISGILFIAGLYFIKRKIKPVLGFFIIISLFLLPLPSISPALPEAEIPSSARTIAIIPFVYLLTGFGVWQVFLLLKRLFTKNISVILTVLMVVISVKVNLTDYFKIYASELPDENLGPSRYIAEYIDNNYPADTALYFAECCWGEAGEPEPKAIVYSLRNLGRKTNINNFVVSCNDIKKPALLLFRDEEKANDNFKECYDNSKVRKISSKSGIYIARLLIIE